MSSEGLLASTPQPFRALFSEAVDLELFDQTSQRFVLQDKDVTVSVFEVENRNCWLRITGKNKDGFGQQIVTEISSSLLHRISILRIQPLYRR